MVSIIPASSSQAWAQAFLGDLFSAEADRAPAASPRSGAEPRAKSQTKPRKASAKPAAPKVQPVRSEPDGTELESALPPDTAQDTTAALKPPPKPKPKVRVVLAPLPPPRPWEDRDAPDVDAPVVASAPMDAGKTAAPVPTVASPVKEAVVPAAQPAAVRRSLVLIVKRNLRGAQDLTDRRIATGLSGEKSERLQEMVERGSGVRLAAVDLSWGMGLESLAKGEVDGVSLSIGPPLGPDEMRGVMMESYQVLEIPLDRDTSSAERP